MLTIHLGALKRDGARSFVSFLSNSRYFKVTYKFISCFISMFWQILKQLFPSVSVPSEKYSPHPFAARSNIFHYSPPLQGIIVNYPRDLECLCFNDDQQQSHQDSGWCFSNYLFLNASKTKFSGEYLGVKRTGMTVGNPRKLP